MSAVKELLIDQLQDLLHAEGLLLEALPRMAEAANHPKLKEGFEKHLIQTQTQTERLRAAFELLGEKPEPKPCKAMMGLIEEGEETIEEGQKKDPMSADLALIAAAQRVEHYEISAYGTAKCLARQAGENECAKLLSHSLGEEESADFLLTALAEPILQQLSIEDMGGGVDLGSVRGDAENAPSRQKSASKKKAARA
jgi:Mn-containing catalase